MSSSSSVQSSILSFNGVRSCYTSSLSYRVLSLPVFLENSAKKFNRNRLKQKKIKDFGKICRAMVQQTVQGPSAAYAREMERLSAKESLLLAVSQLIHLFSVAHFSIIWAFIVFSNFDGAKFKLINDDFAQLVLLRMYVCRFLTKHLYLAVLPYEKSWSWNTEAID